MERPRGTPRKNAEPLLTTREAAARLGMHERSVRRAIARGEIPALKTHGVYRISAAEIDRIASLREAPYPPQASRQRNEESPISLLPPPPDLEPLPVPLTSFIGRADERAAVAALLQLRDGEPRLLTLMGPGGIGKTRLAIAAAGDVAAEFSDGAVFVGLAAVARPELVLPAIAGALSVKESAGQDLEQRLRAFLRPRQLLLVLDNFEHLLAAAPLVARLLMHAPGLTVLATSRTALRIGGEREFIVPALSLPLPNQPMTTAGLLASEAGRLFVERARGIDASWEHNEAVAAAVSDICVRLDGLPLAIELAAARVKTLSPLQLRERLERRLPLLTGGPRDAPDRQRTLRNAIVWSYDLLSDDEQRLFRLLAIFSGGFTLEASEAISNRLSAVSPTEVGRGTSDSRLGVPSGSPNSSSVLDLVESLVEQSLLLRERGVDGAPRFRMLETIREYGLERLEEHGKAAAAREAHAAYFLALAQQSRPLANTRSTNAPLDVLTANDANLRAALAWLEQRGPVSDFIAMVTASYTFLFALSHFREAETWLERALAVQDEGQPAERARLVIGGGELRMVQGQFAQADALLAEGVTLMRALDDPFDLAMALISQGASFNYGGDSAAAEAALEEALSIAPAITEETLQEAVAGRALANLSVSARGQGELDLAVARGEAALARFHGRGLELAETRTLMDLGDIARDHGDHHRAVARYEACLALASERSEQRLVAESLAGIASAAAAWGRDREALLLFGAAGAFRERTGYGMLLPADAATADRTMQDLRARGGARVIEATLAEGHALSLAEAKEVAALVAPPAGGARAPGVISSVALTEREREVLRLLVARSTDREIAEALFLSPRTVHWHVASILGKLGAGSRREAAELAVSEGLV
jgi:excisionase family DNA binding protein